MPSLKTIQSFNPAWIIPEPAATDLKRIISFEVLDQGKTTKKSNKIKNPNVQKISNHQPLSELFGLVAVTNAEKVILDRIEEKNGQISWFEDSDDEKDRQANELRNLIGKLPALSIFIDEVHHAVSDEIKLRAVVSKWAKNNTMNSVIGFSGTPYLESAERFEITDKLAIASAEITNIVYYYPIVKGIGNFLKRPVVKIADITDSSRIIEKGVREFFNNYKDTVYEGNVVAKLGIYCGTIEKLEQLVYPLVSGILSEYGITSDVILKFHKGNKQYTQPTDSQMQFDLLDKAVSKIRVVLLVQIGKEGWDCKSLTGIILSQEGDCPRNMVLQTSCRCLRQVAKGVPESALIYLNDSNAEKLNAQLIQQHHITLKEFASADNIKITIRRYDRTGYLKLPKVDFYQLKIRYESLVVEKADVKKGITDSLNNAAAQADIIKTTDIYMKYYDTSVESIERGEEPATFTAWLYRIVKGGFGSISMGQLGIYTELLKHIFDRITFVSGGVRYYSSKYKHAIVDENIRKAFCDKCSFTTKEERIPENANLLNIDNFKTTVQTDKQQDYYPDEKTVENIILDDNGKLKIDPKIQQIIDLSEETGNKEYAETLRKKYSSHPQKDRSFHYLPYRTDSGFEQKFLSEVLALDDIVKYGLEVYYNGDGALTEFKIKCYKNSEGKWSYVGMYTPDFLIIKRKDGEIYKAIIVETKGEIYKNDPSFKNKKSFVETEFLKQNNQAFGYKRFDYLYLEDTLSESERIITTHNKICEFFEKV